VIEMQREKKTNKQQKRPTSFVRATQNLKGQPFQCPLHCLPRIPFIFEAFNPKNLNAPLKLDTNSKVIEIKQHFLHRPTLLKFGFSLLLPLFSLRVQETYYIQLWI
jgi:hypothetical protein